MNENTHMLLNMAKFDFSFAGFLSQTTAVFRDQLATNKAQDIPSSVIIFNFYHMNFFLNPTAVKGPLE